MAEHDDRIRRKSTPRLAGYLAGTLTLLLLLFFFPVPSTKVQASGNFGILIQDNENLLTAEEEENLSDVMEPITQYGNVMFMSTGDPQWDDPEWNAALEYDDAFGYTDGLIFYIDMKNRILTLYSYGSVYDVISEGYARTITDNVYTYASDGDYYACAKEAFTEAYTLLEGRSISQPMRVITNVFLAFMLAFLAAFLILTVQRSRAGVSGRETARVSRKQPVMNVVLHQVISRKTYHRESSSGTGSSSGGGGGSFGGGGGGGGGGSHGF